MKKTAKELQIGEAFKTSPTKKNLHLVSKIFDLSKQENTPEHHKDHFLFIVDGCRQVTLHKDSPVF